MKSFFLANLFLILLPFSGSAEWIRPSSGDHCPQELQEVLQLHFGAQAKVTLSRNYGTGWQWNLWALTNLCSGYFYASFLGEGSTCRQPRYGQSRILISVQGYGDCKRLVPHNLYW